MSEVVKEVFSLPPSLTPSLPPSPSLSLCVCSELPAGHGENWHHPEWVVVCFRNAQTRRPVNLKAPTASQETNPGENCSHPVTRMDRS